MPPKSTPSKPKANRAGSAGAGPAIARDPLTTRLAVALAAIAAGPTRLPGLAGQPELRPIRDAMAGFGALLQEEESDLVVHGLGNGCLLEAAKPVDAAGDTVAARLIAGLAGVYHMETMIAGGDGALSGVLEPLRRMGVQVSTDGGEAATVTLRGPRTANPIVWHPAAAPPDAKAAVLLAALNAPGATAVIGGDPLDEATIDLFRVFGAVITATEADGGQRIEIDGQGALAGCALRFR